MRDVLLSVDDVEVGGREQPIAPCVPKNTLGGTRAPVRLAAVDARWRVRVAERQYRDRQASWRT